MTRTRAANAAALPSADRRAFLGNSLALASAVAATAVPAAASAHPDAELLDLGRQWQAVRRDNDTHNELVHSLGAEEFRQREASIEIEGDTLFKRQGALFSAITSKPALTNTGLSIKARVVAHEFFDEDQLAAVAGVGPSRALSTLLADIDRLAEAEGPVAAETVVPAAEVGADEGDRLEDATSEALGEVVARITAISARTLPGICFKIEVSADYDHDSEELRTSIMSDVLAMGGHADVA